MSRRKNSSVGFALILQMPDGLPCVIILLSIVLFLFGDFLVGMVKFLIKLYKSNAL